MPNLEKSIKFLEDRFVSNKVFIYSIIIIFSWRYLFLFLSDFELLFDEAQYWTWSRSFELGYFSKPPLIAWVISVSTWLCGSTEACVRLSAPLFHVGTALLIAGIVARFWTTKLALVAALLYLSAPGVSFSAILMTTDAPLLFFWTLSLYAVVRLHTGGAPAWWLVVGLGVGAGLLAKYSMGYFVLSLAIYLIAVRDRRKLLKTAWFPLAVVIAGLFFMPNVIWNLQNGFITVGHTAYVADWHNMEIDVARSLERAGAFVAVQFGLMGPIAGVAFCLVLIRFKRHVFDRKILLLLCFCLPPLVLMILQALVAKAYGGWAAPALVSAIALSAWFLWSFARRIWIVAAIALNVATAAGIYHYDLLIAPALSAWLPDPHARMRGWTELAREVDLRSRAHPNPVIVVGERKVFSELSYYLRHRRPTIVKWNPYGERRDGFDISTHIRNHPNRPYLMIVSPETTVFARGFFCRLSKPVPVRSARGTILRVRLQAMWAWGFRGYDPAKQSAC